MPQAILPILTNILVAAMFIGAFLVTAHTYPMVRRACWFALAFAFGVIGPRHLARSDGDAALLGPHPDLGAGNGPVGAWGPPRGKGAAPDRGIPQQGR